MVLTPRISENYRYDTNIDRLANVRAEADAVNDMAASGRKLRTVSDDPAGTIKVFKNRSALTHIAQFKKSIEFGRSYLSKTEETIGSIFDSLLRAKELAIQQSNSTYSEQDRLAVASEINQIKQHVTRLGNSRYNEKYIFGGFQTSQPPISPDGNYLGDDGKIYIQVDEDSFRPINVDGRVLFDSPTDGTPTRPPLIHILKNLQTSLEEANSEKLHSSMVDLEAAMDTILMAQSSIGARQNSLNDVSERMEKSEVAITQENNSLESTDMVKTAVDLKRAESALQFTLQASSKMLAPSLIDFMK
jgi:flagellar hook-associated protein 3 FlgL